MRNKTLVLQQKCIIVKIYVSIEKSIDSQTKLVVGTFSREHGTLSLLITK